MTFKEAVRILGGPREAAAASGVARTVILYWLKNGVSRFRGADGERIVSLAEQRAAVGPQLAEGDGFIYFAKFPDRDVVKIGFSTRPWVRVRQLAFDGHYGTFFLLGYCAAVQADEMALHKDLAWARLESAPNGEFYHYSAITDLIAEKLSPPSARPKPRAYRKRGAV